ncbi:ribonuclease III [Pseudohoeflea coraliihabitans]|uniref:Ribonuclease 3 n=1 Tax=Pseudohoeflea coraliihabitans TaxID=2860393 RepID=A0ABS6WPG4_9HYPH|nr:ribonuclease III [Pseudohoeflea sp. DP4N28-3]MBW3097841.1 ribonuclease III [Pseudohoeflea sp. DP4N28-3]
MSAPKKAADEIVDAVAARIGYRFTDGDRLLRALSHSSLRDGGGGNYERLEFLGDRVLGLCVAELLFKHFGDADEGELSVRLNHLVSAKTCAEVADELKLHEFIRTGADVKKLTSKRLANVRADVIESLIAAIYLEAGLEEARRFVAAQWSERALKSGSAQRDAKTELQEWSHQKFGSTPVYRVAERSGPDHDPVFKVVVEVKDGQSANGESRSKRMAEQAAAGAFLRREGIWKQDDGDE